MAEVRYESAHASVPPAAFGGFSALQGVWRRSRKVGRLSQPGRQTSYFAHLTQTAWSDIGIRSLTAEQQLHEIAPELLDPGELSPLRW